ncbi:PHD and RING finger domain-containing protein 1 isoform X1 [Elephas maximus indicus]|uniref:PHD and RING finger domain-containing protein 1 isoform X1 n=1 Tax=Elephas maximus indicus TaxID=99487 RepID=UPI002115FD68|nr:PHD and RING finger domain-containing protein 1 isoform X1 [Elephas maximus indicus]XP_049748924.1 PHD and RING finger domain-containing protein 1 isoform X1 [Elephas maximus indicus]XP_049748926.1 PHD and RING finger domain-containing protein 1 isoform X1 [Elephas maximus indicus]XP_049748927.1 PHD and RING finger domain-containing protein 1 isoform X1 [Elephas maximus indicus]
MDDDSLDELTERSTGPGGRLWPSPTALASDAGDSSNGNNGDSDDDTGSQQRDSTGEDEGGTSEDEDLEDSSGSEDSEEEDVEALVAAADTQKRKLEADGTLSSDSEAESCPICLNVFRDQAVGTPETCAHYFCLDCIVEWSKNANSCPVDRTVFKCVCVRARFGGKILRKIPVENTRAPEAEEEDPTFCEVCGRSDREDRLLLCDGCDAGYHMECLDPPLQEVPVDEWFCPECAALGAGHGPDPGHVSEEEVTLLLADVVPTTSRLRPSTGRTRAIARTRQSERVRATVNRNRITTARRIQHVPRYLMSSLLDETIEAVASGLSTAVYQRPMTPRAPVKRKRKSGRRKRVLGRKRASSRSSASRAKRRLKRRKGKKLKVRDEVTARVRIARTLGLRKPVHGASFPSVYKPSDPSLSLMRADIGAASLSLFGDPDELDPFDSSEELSANPASPLSAKRRVLSQSALLSHQPVARPVSMTLARRGVPAATTPEPEVEAAPVPDLLGSILCSQSLLMMSSADVVIHRDGSLSAKRAAPAPFQQNSLRVSSGAWDCRPDCRQPTTLPSGSPAGGLTGSGLQSSATTFHSRPTPAPASWVPAHTARPAVRLGPSAAPQAGAVQAQNLANSTLGSHRGAQRQFNRDSKHASPASSMSPKTPSSDLHSLSRRPVLGHPVKPAPRRRDVSELPRIPKIKRDAGGGRVDSAPARGPSVEIPSSCISRLTGREGTTQPGRGAQAEGQPSGRAPQEPGAPPGGPQPTAPGSHSSLAAIGATRGKGTGSTFESFRINIPGNTAHSSRLPGPGFCNTFRPVDNKVQRKENPSPLFSLKKTKQLKSEIYDPFDPTGSDSSSAGSSPERLGSSLLPSEITRTISIRSPKAPACQTVRCVTTYTVEDAFGAGPEPSRRPASSVLRLQDGAAYGSASDLEPEGLGAPEEVEGEDEDAPRHSTFFGSKARTVTCVTVTEPDTPPRPDTLPPTTHRIVELRSPSPAHSDDSFCGQKGVKKGKASASEPRRTRSRSRSGSRSRERSSRSASPSAGEPHIRKHWPKARARRSSSEGSSSRDRAKRKKAKDKGREKKRGSWGRARRSRSRSASPSSSSHEHHEGRKKKAQRSPSRSRGRECSPPSSLERSRRHKRRRERSRERTNRKEGVSRPRGRRHSRERRVWRSRSPSMEQRAREQRRPRSHERQPGTRSCSPYRKPPAKEPSPPPTHDVPGQDGSPTTRPPALAQVEVPAAGVEEAPTEAPPVPEVPAESVPDDLDYGDSVEAGHVFEDFSSEAVFIQLDDMSSPPSPESTDSSPERAPLGLLPPVPGRACDVGLDTGRALAAIQREVSLIHSDDPQPSPLAERPPERVPLEQDATGASQAVGTLGVGREVGPQAGEGAKPEEATPQTPLLRLKAPVKRVTWNLQEEEDSTLAEDRAPRVLLHRPLKPRDTAWDAEDSGPATFRQELPFSEPPPPSQALPEPVFPDVDASQVYSPALPVPLALPSSGPPYAPISQPAVQFLLQGSLPLVGCGGAQGLIPAPTALTTASEPAIPAPMTNDMEEKTTASKPSGEKAKNEEYLKKLHMQERAVEEVKLAIKPFYQKREITKEEYKDILRKAVQKICHSKSGEINPMKVANLVKAYVEKYRHMRRYKKADPEEGLPPQEAEG